MPQFDLLFFSIITIFVFMVCLVFIFIFFINFFISFFKIKKFSYNLHSQKMLILTIKKELEITESMRIKWIKEKMIEFYND